MSVPSGGNPDEGNPVEGSPGGSSTGSDGNGSGTISQSELEAVESRRRSLQSQVDKLLAQNTDLEKKMSDGLNEERVAQIVKEQMGTLQMPKAEDIAAVVGQKMAQQTAQRQMQQQLAEKFPGIDASQLSGSPEEMAQAAETQHQGREEAKTALRAEVETALREKYEAKFGSLEDGNSDVLDQGDSGTPDGGELTVEKFIGLSPQEEDSLDDEQWTKMMKKLEAAAS